jgi:DNA-binding MarR family transcriptional regulator
MSHIADLRHVFHQLEYLSEKIAKHYGVEHLAGPQGHVLHFLGDHMDTELKISKSVASNLVKRMEKNGFVQIIPSVVDKRFKQVVLTPLGQEKLQPLRDWHQEMSESLFRGIPREDFQSMIRLIHQLKENIKQYKENNDV